MRRPQCFDVSLPRLDRGGALAADTARVVVSLDSRRDACRASGAGGAEQSLEIGELGGVLCLVGRRIRLERSLGSLGRVFGAVVREGRPDVLY